MYIEYKSIAYPCTCRPGRTMTYRGLPGDFPAPADDEIVLCSDDGFVLRTDNPDDYLRQSFDNGTLVLTNTPEPETVDPDERELGDTDILNALLGYGYEEDNE